MRGTGRLGKFLKFMSDEPQTTTAWKKGGGGEQRLGLRLNERISSVGVVLHDRRIPGKKSNIDQRKKSETSLMPADLQKVISEKELVDIVEFMTTLKEAQPGAVGK